MLAGWVAPVFTPLGFGDWRIVTSLVSGFLAKESIVSTLTVLFGSSAALTTALVPATALSLLVFCLLYTPCIATVATIRHEMGTCYAATLIVWQCAIAWLCAFIVHMLYALIL